MTPDVCLYSSYVLYLPIVMLYEGRRSNPYIMTAYRECPQKVRYSARAMFIFMVADGDGVCQN